MSALDQAVRRHLIHKFRLGLFENPYPAEKKAREGLLQNGHAEALSRKIATESIVLLKNDGVLPLKAHGKKIALIGWHGGTPRAYMGCYMYSARMECGLGGRDSMAGIEAAEGGNVGIADGTYPGSNIQVEPPGVSELLRKLYPGIKSLYEELQERLGDCGISYFGGYPYAGNDTSQFKEALAAAEKADIVIVTLGGKYGWNTTCTVAEGIDSMNINLPECQEMFLRQLSQLNKPSIGIHFDGRPLSSDAADETLNAILEAWTPGRYGAEAVCDVLLGEYSPAGRLPVSVACSSGQIPVYYNHESGSCYHQGESIGFPEYADGTHTPRYYFGHGLSYLKFIYEKLTVERRRVLPFEPWTVRFEVANTGSCDGQEVVQIYMQDLYASVKRPVMELVAFGRVTIQAGSTRKIECEIYPSQLAFLDIDRKWKIEKGEFRILIGASSSDIRLETSLSVSEDAWIDGASRKFYTVLK